MPGQVRNENFPQGTSGQLEERLLENQSGKGRGGDEEAGNWTHDAEESPQVERSGNPDQEESSSDTWEEEEAETWDDDDEQAKEEEYTDRDDVQAYLTAGLEAKAEQYNQFIAHLKLLKNLLKSRKGKNGGVSPMAARVLHGLNFVSPVSLFAIWLIATPVFGGDSTSFKVIPLPGWTGKWEEPVSVKAGVDFLTDCMDGNADGDLVFALTLVRTLTRQLGCDDPQPEAGAQLDEDTQSEKDAKREAKAEIDANYADLTRALRRWRKPALAIFANDCPVLETLYLDLEVVHLIKHKEDPLDWKDSYMTRLQKVWMQMGPIVDGNVGMGEHLGGKVVQLLGLYGECGATPDPTRLVLPEDFWWYLCGFASERYYGLQLTELLDEAVCWYVNATTEEEYGEDPQYKELKAFIEDTELGQAFEVKASLVRSLQELLKFTGLCQGIKQNITEDDLCIYSVVTFGSASYLKTKNLPLPKKLDAWMDYFQAYLFAAGIFAMQMMLPFCVLLYYMYDQGYELADDDGHTELVELKGWCDNSGTTKGKVACFAVALYYLMASIPRLRNSLAQREGPSKAARGKEIDWEEEANGALYKATINKLFAYDPTATFGQRTFAFIEQFQNQVYPHLIALVVFYIIYNDASSFDIVVSFLGLEFIYDLDEQFLGMCRNIYDIREIQAHILIAKMCVEEGSPENARTARVKGMEQSREPWSDRLLKMLQCECDCSWASSICSTICEIVSCKYDWGRTCYQLIYGNTKILKGCSKVLFEVAAYTVNYLAPFIYLGLLAYIPYCY